MARMRMAVALVTAAMSVVIFASSAAAEDVRITGREQVTDRILELTVDTPAFKEPSKLHVILPTGYDADPARRWPVTYVLAGTMNNYDSFQKFLGGEKLSENHPAIIVSPDGNSGYWSDWYNGGAFGPPEYETFVTRQLIPLIDANFRTVADRSQRTVLGISMGGYGSLMMAARRPDLFVAAASLSGSVDSNLPLNGIALTISSTFDGAGADAIYGPRATEEVRWRGHNPTDLSENLRDVDLQLLTANGTLAPEIGEEPDPDQVTSCVVERGVYDASVSMHERLNTLGIAHRWLDYGPGCHTPPNFKREVLDTFTHFEKVLSDPPPPPAGFEYRSIEPRFAVWGWEIGADPKRALEFMGMKAGRNTITLEGSGRTEVTTPPWYSGLKAVDVNGTPTRPGADGRLRFDVDLGPAHTIQQFTPGAADTFKSRRVDLAPHALVRITKVKRVKRGLRVCVKATGGTVRKARLRAGKRMIRLNIGAAKRCRTLRLGKRQRPRAVTVRGKDGYGHAVKAKAAIRSKR
jgi:S-formylglutathione hydrolase FrmB